MIENERKVNRSVSKWSGSVMRVNSSSASDRVRRESVKGGQIIGTNPVQIPLHNKATDLICQPNRGIMQTIKLSSGLSDLSEIFMENRSNRLEIFGEIDLIDKKRKTGNSSVISVGVLLVSGDFCIYYQSGGLGKILHLSAYVNVKGGLFGLHNQEFRVKAPISFRFTPKDKTQISNWNQGLSKFCDSIKKKPLLKSLSLVDTQSLQRFRAKMDSHVKSIKEKWKMPESIQSITNDSWYCEDNFLTSSKSFPVENILISSPNLEIDEKFFISSNLWARITKSQQNLPAKIFAIMSATLTMERFCLKEYKNETVMTTDNIGLERSPCGKWSFRISNDDMVIEIKLNSKQGYEKWLQAFVKVYKYKSCNGQANQKNISIPNPPKLSEQTPNLPKQNHSPGSDELPEANGIIYRNMNFQGNSPPLEDHVNDIVMNEEQTNEKFNTKLKVYKNKLRPKNENTNICPICDFVYDKVKESDIYISLPVRCERKASAQKTRLSSFIAQFVPKFIDRPRKGNFRKDRTSLSSLSEWNLSKTNIEYKLKKRRASSNYISSELRMSQELSECCNHFVSDRLSNTEEYRSNFTKSQPTMRIEKMQNSSSEENIYEEPISSIK